MKMLFVVGMLGLAVSPSVWSVDTSIVFLTPTVSGGQASQTANSTRLETDNKLYQAVYNASDWSGNVLEYDVQTSGAVISTASSAVSSLPNTRALITSGDDTDSNGVIDEGVVLTASNMASTSVWSVVSGAVSSQLPSYSWGWSELLDYLNDGSDTSNVARSRSSVIGDVVNSAPQFSGNFNFGYESLASSAVLSATSSPGDLYYSYIASGGASSIRNDMIYVGANDGSLHGFDAEQGLKEIFAFYPQQLWIKLPQLADTGYSHQYYVDGSAKVADAFDVSSSPQAWKTVLVGTTGAGGSGVFALDVTNPAGHSGDADSFAADTVLWEIDETTSGYSDLGYTLAQASIVLLNNGQWAALVGNGYYANSSKSQLYIVDLFSGSLITVVDTGVATDGLSAPVAVDTDDDSIADLAYAGDLAGNLWRFDLSDPDTANWSVSQLYIASQPITGKPGVVKHEDGQLVLFGTGKYFEDGDKTVSPSGSVNTFYGILDNNSTNAVATNKLVEQTILFEGVATFGGTDFTVRATSDNDVAYTSKSGWFIEFGLDSDDFLERIVSAPVLRNGRVIFTTLIPDGVAYSGTGWLMELDALTGARLDTVAFDLDGDDAFTVADKVTITDPNSGPDIVVAVSGLQSTVGLISTPNVISAGDREFKYNSGSDGGIQVTTESTGDADDSRGHGRTGWLQLR
ncbi:MAG: PilC/PilY family type IV pilus protein [Motiliproteus sp.]